MIRRSLTPRQRFTMWKDQGEACANPNCGALISLNGCIAEHSHPVALGNTGAPDCLLCHACADIKTNGTAATTYGSDKHAIARAKRLAKGGKTVRYPFPKPPPGHSHNWPKRKVGQ